MKKTDLSKLIQPHILGITPYSSARDEFKGKAEIFLDANENAYGTPLEDSFCSALNRYPDPHSRAIREKLAALKSVSADNIMISNGSDEAIDLLIRIFCRPGIDNIIITPPTFGMYKVSASINNVAVLKAPLTAEFQLDADKVLQTATANTKLIFLCSPNNPTGNLLERSEMIRILDNFSGIVVVDEAYIDFANQVSFIAELKNYGNLCVTQTFSKARGLAGIRTGCLYAGAEIISSVSRIKLPYNVNAVSQGIALQSLEEEEFLKNSIQSINFERAKLIEKLRAVPAVEKVYPSAANFILVKFKSANEIFELLLKNGIVVRNQSSQPQCENCLRIGIGTDTENEALIRVLTGRT